MPRALTVTAIIAAYNEEDVIGAVLADLVSQGVRVHLLDHGSSDGTVAEAKRFLRRGLVKIEHLDPGEFSLARIIRRKEALAAELSSDWFVNADADEFRESPWPGVGFVEALHEVDRLGFNAVDFAVLNFPPVHDGFSRGDPREAFRFYEPGARYDRLQVRCWKKQPGPLDLVSTAGHEARFADRRVFPLRFLLRHYPIRGQVHGERKVFQERLPRFAAEERARGWHVQYDGLREGASFLREPSSLTPYDPWAARLELALHHRGAEALEAKLATGREDLERARAELSARGEELVGARNEAASVRNELVAGRAELAGVRGELSASREAFASARELAAVLERELAEARAARLALEQRADAVARERDELKQAHERLRGEYDERSRALEGLRQERDELLGARQKLRAEHDEQSRALEGLRHERDELKQAHEKLRAAHDKQSEMLESVRGERDTLVRAQERLQAESEARERELQQLRPALEQARSELRQRSGELSMLRQELATAVETNERRLGALRHRLDAVLSSRIWRWSAPMRALLDALQRG